MAGDCDHNMSKIQKLKSISNLLETIKNSNNIQMFYQEIDTAMSMIQQMIDNMTDDFK